MVLYSGICTVILMLWPGVNTRYAMPIAPSVAVLAGVAWDALEKSRYAVVKRVTATTLGLLVIYQIFLVVVIMPLFADRFGETRLAARTIDVAMRTAPAPAYCLRLDTNVFFYFVYRRGVSTCKHGHTDPPVWLLMPHAAVTEFANCGPTSNCGSSSTGYSISSLPLPASTRNDDSEGVREPARRSFSGFQSVLKLPTIPR